MRAQAEAFREFVPYYAGARFYRGDGIKLPSERTIVINHAGTNFGKIKEIPFKVLGYAPLFFQKIRKVSPVLIHAHSGPAALSALPLARYLHVPLVASFHGSDVTVDPEKRARLYYTARAYWRHFQTLQSQGALFIAISKFVRERLLEQGYPDERTVLHYIGVDTEFFKPDQQTQREPVVLFVGTLHQVKGCDYLIRAMTTVQSEMPEVELVVIGDGPSRRSLEGMASESLRRYRFLGTQPPEVVRDLMNRAMVFSVPSVKADSGATEAFGLVFAEAQAMGLPVASFSSGGIPEAVADGETGLLAPERDWERLADNLLRLLNDQVLWTRMSAAGRKRSGLFFNLEKQTRQLEELYRSVLGERRLPGKLIVQRSFEAPVG